MLNRKIALMIGMTLMLGACSTVDGMLADLGHAFKSKPASADETVHPNPVTNGQALKPGPDHPTAPVTPMDLSYNRIASEMSNGSVELYSLDQPGQPVIPARRTAQATGRRSAGTGSYGIEGVPSSTDPSVTVFPFSNTLYTPGIRPGIRGYSRPSSLDNEAAGLNYEAVPLFAGNPNKIYFDHGSAALSGTARQALASIAMSYGAAITVEGYASQRAVVTDPKLRGEVNLRVSMKRAMAVTKELIKQGVPATKIKTTAFGDARPAVPEIDAASEALNRRVEILTRP